MRLVTPLVIRDGLADLQRDGSAGNDQIDRLSAQIEQDFTVEDAAHLLMNGSAVRADVPGNGVELHDRLLPPSLPHVLEGVNWMVEQLQDALS